MRIRINDMEKQRSFGCNCLHSNIVVESLVVVLTVVSGLAITGENLLAFDIITVPKYAVTTSNVTSGNHSDNNVRTGVITENAYVTDILMTAFRLTSLGISGLFFLEVFLKVCTLQKKYLLNCWQILDMMVVLVTLVLELVVYFIFFNRQAFRSLNYFVLLRLLCNIRANAVEEVSQSDMEIYRSGKLKAEERCQMLENTLSHRTETIRTLEKLLRSLTGSTQSDVAVDDGQIKNNVHLLKKPREADDTYGAMSESRSPSMPGRTLYSSLLRSPEESRKTFLHEMETQFTSVTEEANPATLRKVKAHASNGALDKGTTKECTETSKDQIILFSNNCSGLVKSDNSDFDCVHRADNCIFDIIDKRSFLYSENMCTHTSSTRLNQMLLRSRKRRSSASEILDYSSMSSLDMNSTKSLSCQRLDLENDKVLTGENCDKNYRDNNNFTISRAEKEVSSTSESASDVISLTHGEKKINQEKKKLRRFMSCPEYVFTQRMSITSDESLLIEDGHANENPVFYNNLGFNYGEKGFLQILAEHDGTKTYRNEDGVPMTSL